jgi:molybdate transport system substrate-binding protein
MNNLNILSGGAAQGLVGSLAPAFKAQTGFDIAGEFGAVGAMADKLRGGMPTDIVILTAALLATLAEEKLVVAASISDVGLVETALAVRAGDPKVTASDEAGLREALLASDAIFLPDTRASTAGIHVAKVLARLGIADAVAARLKIFPNGATAMRELAASDARRPIGCTQSTEIISTPGVVLSGSLPPGCDLATMYTAAVATHASNARQAKSLIDLLIGPDQSKLRESAGFLDARN